MNPVHRWHWVVLTSLVALVSGCGWHEVVGSGIVVTEERPTSSFVALDVSSGLETAVLVDATQPTRVRIVGDDNLVARVVTQQQEAGTLSVLLVDQTRWSSSNPLRVEVTVPRLESVTRSGGGTVEVSGSLYVPSFRLVASGGGTVKIQGLATQDLDLTTSGGVELTLAGQTAQVSNVSSGGGTLYARELYAQQASLSFSGGGSAVMRVSDSLDVAASGGTDVHIIGHPQVVSEVLSGGSTLTFE